MKDCKKCGQTSINVKFKHEGEEVYWSEHKEIEGISKFTRNDTYYYSDKIDNECLVYKCNICGYQIAEKPLDKQTQTN